MLYPNIEAERARAGKTKRTLAKELGVTAKTLLNWQEGKHRIPTDKLLLMCDMFGCSVDYLLGRTTDRISALAQANKSVQNSA